jgi:hypothetical protein
MATNNAINNNLGGQVYYATKTLNSTQIAAMNGAPILFDTISNPGANKAIVIKYWGFDLSFNSAAYTGGGAINLYYDNARTQQATVNVAATNMTAAASVCTNGAGSAAIIPGANAINKPIYISNATAAFATGDSNVTFFAFYSIINIDSSGFPQNCINNQSNNNTFNVAELYIPSAQVQTLNGTPLSIVGAPAAGQAIMPERMTSILIFNSVAYSSSLVSLIPHGGATSLLTSTGSFISGTATQFQTTAVPSLSNYTPSNLSGLGLDVKASANPGASGDSALKIYLSYSIITL